MVYFQKINTALEIQLSEMGPKEPICLEIFLRLQIIGLNHVEQNSMWKAYTLHLLKNSLFTSQIINFSLHLTFAFCVVIRSHKLNTA